MVRTALLGLLLALAACGNGGKDKVVEAAAGGPLYSPAVANSLRAIAANCKLEKTGAVEKRECTGRFGQVSIATVGNHLSALTIALPSKLLAEAKGHIGHGLKEVLGHEGVEALLARMAMLETGQRADITVGTAKVALIAAGRSRLAPEYTVELVWP
jgi:hypothetical protein